MRERTFFGRKGVVKIGYYKGTITRLIFIGLPMGEGGKM
jgi:hypothetical protein